MGDDGGNESGDDSDMQHLNTMMDKILDIQHPERLRERVKGSNTKETKSVLSLSSWPSNLSFISLLDTAPQKGQRRLPSTV